MKRNWLAAAALLATASAWGASFTVVRDVLAQIAPEPFIAWRFTIAGAILLAIAWLRRSLSRNQLFPGLILGLLVFTGYEAQTHGLRFISAPRSAFLTGLYVVMVPFADRLVYRTRIGAQAWIGSVLALAGTAVLVGGFDARPSFGDWLTIFCAVLFALHVILSARWSVERSATGLAAIQVMFVGLAAIPLTPFAPKPVLSTGVAVVILFTAVVTTALAFAALMWGQARVSATEAAVILAFEPVAAAITAIVWDHEPVTVSFVVSSVLILAAMVISQLPAPRRGDATMRADGTHPRHE